MTPRVLLIASLALAFASASASAQTTGATEPAAAEMHQTAAAAPDPQPAMQPPPAAETPSVEAPHAAPARCAAWRRPERAGLEFVLVPLDWFREGLSALRRGITC